jgi:chemotaxis protein methyltransferase CheR
MQGERATRRGHGPCRASPWPLSFVTAPLLAPAAAIASVRAATEPAVEAQLGRAEFERVRELIHRRAGISLHAGKQAMVHSRLSRRLREGGHASFGAYLDALEHGGASQWQAFVNSLTTNLTAFFREAHHFALLAEALRARPDRAPSLWCNAASTGEEPYSLAMTLAETLGTAANARILATDIDTRVLATAVRAIYDADARGLSPARLRAHFLRGKGAQAGSIRVKPELARAVEFRGFNLAEPRWSLHESFDIVFCRNVMIYFDAPTQRRVLERTHAALRPGGLLFVGHSESLADARELFRPRGKTVYERVG